MTVERIEAADEHFAALSSILHSFRAAKEANNAEIGALRGEQHLEHARKSVSTRPRVGSGPRLYSRTDMIADKVRKHRASAPAAKAPEPATSGEFPEAVNVALSLLKGARAPGRFSPKELIAQLEGDNEKYDAAIAALDPIVAELRGELTAKRSIKRRPNHLNRQEQIIRHLQAAAALNDESDDEKQAELAAGYSPLRPDLLPEFMTRALLSIGSERIWDSPISQARRAIEEAKR